MLVSSKVEAIGILFTSALVCQHCGNHIWNQRAQKAIVHFKRNGLLGCKGECQSMRKCENKKYSYRNSSDAYCN